MIGRGWAATLLAASCAAALAVALPATASARIAYVTGAGHYGEGLAAPVELDTGVFGGELPVATEGVPRDVAISPNGKTAYVTSFNGILPIDVATDKPEPEIAVGPSPCLSALATSPDGARLYAADCFGHVDVIDTAAGKVLTEIPLPGSASGIAVTPDGTRALVTDTGEGTVIPIDLATNTAGAQIPVGSSPQGIAVAPDGTRAYVALSGGAAIVPIELATNAVGTAIPVAAEPREIAITPDSSRAYVTSSGSDVTPVDLKAGTAGAAIPAVAQGFLEDVAITPDGSRAWVTKEEPGELIPISIPADAIGAPYLGPLDRMGAIAIVPNQPPHAAFTATPQPALRGDAIAFDGTGTTDSDGTVARYEWDFGDGGPPVVAGPNPTHTYNFGGTYTVTLTTTDDEGCSTGIVFPGQTAYCNGSGVARVSHPVQVNPKCIDVTGSASSFVPKFRAANVVPGLRLRLAASAPARLTVEATMRLPGKSGGGTATLPQLVTNVQQWRRVRYVIPSKLRSKLPLGSKVRISLRIAAAPLDESLCPGKAVEKSLRLRVVKVIPGSVQAGRRK